MAAKALANTASGTTKRPRPSTTAGTRRSRRPKRGPGSRRVERPTAPQVTTVTVSCPQTTGGGRRLTIDYTALFEGLLSLPDPQPSAIQNTLVAADLIAVADGSHQNFGAATTADQAEADFVEQVISIPDAVFSTAHDLIGNPYEGDNRPARKSASGAEVARAIMEDHVVSGGFFDSLYLLLANSPPARNPAAGTDIL